MGDSLVDGVVPGVEQGQPCNGVQNPALRHNEGPPRTEGGREGTGQPYNDTRCPCTAHHRPATQAQQLSEVGGRGRGRATDVHWTHTVEQFKAELRAERLPLQTGLLCTDNTSLMI